MNQELVSVIIPVYNRSEKLKRAIQSVLNQTYPYIEIIVVDDGSDEDITEAIMCFPNNDIRVIRQQNSGPGIARRTGLAASHGVYIQYLDSDDEILPTKIEEQIAELEQNPNAIMCFTSTQQVEANDSRRIRKFSDQPCENLLKTALQWRRWSTSSCLWRYPDKNIPYWSHLYNGEDVVHDVSVGVHEKEVSFILKPLTLVYQDSESVSLQPQDSDKLERYKTNMVECPMLCLDLLSKNHLNHISDYATPLAERMYHNGLVLAKSGDTKRSLYLLKQGFNLSRNILKKFEIAIAFFAVFVTQAKMPELYRLLFKIHRKIVKPEIHVYRSV